VPNHFVAFWNLENLFAPEDFPTANHGSLSNGTDLGGWTRRCSIPRSTNWRRSSAVHGGQGGYPASARSRTRLCCSS
jgi:hypothetical protein